MIHFIHTPFYSHSSFRLACVDHCPVLAHSRSSDGWGFLCLSVGSIACCIKCLEPTVVVIIRCYINKTKLK